MVRGAFPLLVDLFVALTASGRIHEKVGGDDAADVGFSGGWEERRFGAPAFAFHGERRGVRIVNAIVRVGIQLPIGVGGKRKEHEDREGELKRWAKTVVLPGVRYERNNSEQ